MRTWTKCKCGRSWPTTEAVRSCSRCAIIAALDATGVRYVLRDRTGCDQVFPSSNLRPWTPDQERQITEALAGIGLGTSTRMLRAAGGKWVEEYEAAPGRGLRILRYAS